MVALIVFFVVFLGLALIRVPIALSLIVGATLGYISIGLGISGFIPAVIAGLNSFPLLAVPAFIYAGDLMGQGGISEALMNFISKIIGKVRGALGAVLVATSMLFGAITGSSLATISAVGSIMVPEMKKGGYSKQYIAALLAASGFLGTLIPPSVPGVMYALCGQQKVLDVWMSTLIPGVVLGSLYMVVNYLVFGRKQPKVTERIPINKYFKEIGEASPKAMLALVLPLVIFGGVYGGIFTATEAGVIAVVLGVILGWFIYPVLFKTKPTLKLTTTTRQSAMSVASIMLLMCGATLVGRMVALGGITQKLSEFLLNITDSKVVFLALVNILMLLVGMFLETNTSIIIFTPILLPIAEAYGIDPVHFGAIILLNIEIGLITPPFAANIFVSCKITDCTVNEMLPQLIPFFGVCLPVLLLTTYWPEFSLWLPHLLNG